MADSRVVVSAYGLVSVETSRLILLEIFPNYPNLEPCRPIPEWAKEKR